MILSLSSESTLNFPSKVCFIQFTNMSSCQTALHLTNSVLLDRALIVVNSKYSESVYIMGHYYMYKCNLSLAPSVC